MPRNPPRICEIEPFVAESTPQPGSLEEASTAGELFQQQVQGYLTRFFEAVCQDLADIIGDCCVGYFSPIIVTSTELDFPSIGSKSAASIDITVSGIPLGTHVVSWAPTTDATSIDDLLIQFLVVAADTVRVTIQNPTAGAVDPDPITFQFILAQAEDTT